MQKKNFKEGDYVVVKDGSYYKITTEGSEGVIVSILDEQRVVVKFYKITGVDPRGGYTYPIDRNDLEINELANTPLWKALS